MNVAHAFEQIASADEQLARVNEQVSRMEQAGHEHASSAVAWQAGASLVGCNIFQRSEYGSRECLSLRWRACENFVKCANLSRIRMWY
jgi:hypothetical protein